LYFTLDKYLSFLKYTVARHLIGSLFNNTISSEKFLQGLLR